MLKEEYKFYKRSGAILEKTFRLALELTNPGAKLLDIAEKLENHIRSYSAVPAFPVNISINEIAAHYSPTINDESLIPEKSIVKIDCGVSVNGYLSDAARTIIFDNQWQKLHEASEQALDNAIKEIGANISVYKLGEVIEQTINKAGFLPISNLTGHSLARYSLHDGISIPNYSISKNLRKASDKFKVGSAYAIEPFATTGIGKVVDGDEITIYMLLNETGKISLHKKIREIYELIKMKTYSLPFSPRLISNENFSEELIEEAIIELYEKGMVRGYPILVEASKAPVTQTEDTIWVGKNKIFNLTRRVS